MPLKLIRPTPGRSPHFRIRGTYLKVYVDRSTGTSDERKARAILRAIETDIEAGVITAGKQLTFADAALSYLQAGGESTFLKRVVNYFGPGRALEGFKQADIDACAHALYPAASAATRNRQVYTPISAVLRHAGVSISLRRPKGAQGKVALNWLRPHEAELVVSAAHEIDPEYGIFWVSLIYTGMRLAEATTLWRCEATDLKEGLAQIPYTKNGDPRPVYLPLPVIEALKQHPRGLNRKQSVFRFRKNGYLYIQLDELRKKTGIQWLDHHSARHTYATWMRRYGGLDDIGLVATGAWKNRKSAARYAHTIVSEEAGRADLLPNITRAKSGSGKK